MIIIFYIDYLSIIEKTHKTSLCKNILKYFYIGFIIKEALYGIHRRFQDSYFSKVYSYHNNELLQYFPNKI